MTKSIDTKSLAMEMATVIDDCLPALYGTGDIVAGLKLGAGVIKIREILDNPEIRQMIEALKDSQLGFLTDRSPAAIEAAKRKNNTLKPYDWETIRECIAEGLLRGYRITGNEINIIAGRFYAAKDGKYRRIIEWPGVTRFEFGNHAPVYVVEQRQNYQRKVEAVQVAEIEVFATWEQDGHKRTFGRVAGKEDKDRQIFRLRAHGGDDDAVVGKALSKLFSRVLMRISGQIMPECTDLEPEVINGDILDDVSGGEMDDITAFMLSVQGDNLPADLMDDFLSLVMSQNHLTEIQAKHEALKDWDAWKKQFNEFVDERDADPDDADPGGPPDDDPGAKWAGFVRSFTRLGPKNFKVFCKDRADEFKKAPKFVHKRAREMWKGFYKGETYPFNDFS